jgi:hypothetical protein
MLRGRNRGDRSSQAAQFDGLLREFIPAADAVVRQMHNAISAGAEEID